MSQERVRVGFQREHIVSQEARSPAAALERDRSLACAGAAEQGDRLPVLDYGAGMKDLKTLQQ